MTTEIDEKALASAVEEHFAAGFKSTPTEAMRTAISAYLAATPTSEAAEPVARKVKPLKDGELVVDTYSREGRVYRVYGDHSDGMVACQINPTERAFRSNGINRLMVIDPKSAAQWLTLPTPASDDQVEAVREAELNLKARQRAAFREALSELPEIAPPEVRAVLASVHMRDEFIREGKRLQREFGFDAVAPRVEQECAAGAWSFMRQGVLASMGSTKP